MLFIYLLLSQAQGLPIDRDELGKILSDFLFCTVAIRASPKQR